MNTYILSDVNFGNDKLLKQNNSFRSLVMGGVTNVDDYNEMIVDNINKKLKKRDVLFLLGNLGVGFEKHINELRCNKMLMLGNQDYISVHTLMGLNYATVIGVRRYKKHWLTPHPIHENELWGQKNIHGGMFGVPIKDERYISTSVEVSAGWPIPMDMILGGEFETYNIESPECAIFQVESLGIK